MTDTTTRSRGWLPWAVAVVLAVLVALLAIALPHVRGVSDRAKQAAEQSNGTVALPTSYVGAVLAGGTEAVNLLTYSRKSFESDWARAVAGATGKLKKDQAAKKATTLKQMTTSKIDLKAKLEQQAFETTGDHGAVIVLITVNGYAVNDKGEQGAQTPQRLELTMVKSGGKWLASNLTFVGIQ